MASCKNLCSSNVQSTILFQLVKGFNVTWSNNFSEFNDLTEHIELSRKSANKVAFYADIFGA